MYTSIDSIRLYVIYKMYSLYFLYTNQINKISYFFEFKLDFAPIVN